MTNIEITELMAVLNNIRNEKYPDIPESLVKAIINAEFSFQDDRKEARKHVSKIIDDFMSKVDLEEGVLNYAQIHKHDH